LVFPALITLRNKFTIKPDEDRIAVSDERLEFVQSWLEGSPGAQEIFDIWSGANPRQHSLLSAVVSCLSAIVVLLSQHYTFHSFGQPIVKAVLSAPWIQHLNGYLSYSYNDLVIATLKLFNAVSAFAGGSEQRNLMNVFAWESKVRGFVADQAFESTTVYSGTHQTTHHAPQEQRRILEQFSERARFVPFLFSSSS